LADSATLTTARPKSVAHDRPIVATLVVAAGTIGTLVVLLATGTPLVSAVVIAMTVPAAAVDVQQRRLPNGYLLVSAFALVAGTAASALSGTSNHASGTVVGAVSMCAPLLAVHLWSPAAMGFGDVKLAVLLGAAVGTVAVPLTLVALALGAGGTSLVGIARRKRTLPFGPGLVGGAIMATASHPLWIGSVTAAVSGGISR